MKTIPLSQGYFAQVDDEDYDRVSQFKWSAAKRRKRIYGVRNIVKNGLRTQELLHHFIFGRPPEGDVDHRDGDGRNNQKANLRPLARRHNLQAAVRKRDKTSSPYRGVHWDAPRKKYQAQICVAGRSTSLGRFSDPNEAARARDAKARELGWLEEGMNFPQ